MNMFNSTLRSVFTNNFFGCEELAPKPNKFIATDKQIECGKKLSYCLSGSRQAYRFITRHDDCMNMS